MDTLTSHAPTKETCKDFCSRASSSLWGRFDENTAAPTLRMTVSGLSLLTTGIFVIGYMLGRHGAESQRASAVALAAAKSGASDADGAEEASTGNPSADGTTTARVRFAESLASTEQAPTPERTSVWVSDGGGGGEDGQEETELEDKGKQRAAEVDGNDSDATATGASPTLRPRSLRLRIPGSDVVTTGDSSRS